MHESPDSRFRGRWINPYGEWPEDALVERLVGLFEHYLQRHTVDLAIVACNTASTLIMPALREAFDIPFVGTVPAIKPAAERTRSGQVTVLATPGTINRQYTRDLIDSFAEDIDVNLVASTQLARLAEHYMLHREVDAVQLREEIQPCFRQSGRQRTDIIVLGCTHYPFLVNEMRKLAPWPVDWIEPAEAIAMQASRVLTDRYADAAHPIEAPTTDIAYLTSNPEQAAIGRLLQGFGLQLKAHRYLLPMSE